MKQWVIIHEVSQVSISTGHESFFLSGLALISVDAVRLVSKATPRMSEPSDQEAKKRQSVSSRPLKVTGVNRCDLEHGPVKSHVIPVALAWPLRA